MTASIREVTPGVHHWTATHPGLGVEVSSYYLEAERVLLDPMLPTEGLAWFQRRDDPLHVVLTNRHHSRASATFVEAFGCRLHCPRSGLADFEHGSLNPTPFDFGVELLSEGIVAYEVGGIWPDESAVHLPAHRALACADGAIRYAADEKLQFAPEQYLGDPEKTKPRIRAAYLRLCEELDFDHLLLAHGDPILRVGKQALVDFATESRA